MDVANYYATTLTNAAQNIGPVILFIVVGYFVFIKLPFMFARKVNKENRPKTEEDSSPKLGASAAPENRPQPNHMRLEDSNYKERLEKAREEKERQQKQWEQARKEKEKQKEKEQKEKQQKEEQRKSASASSSKSSLAEELFEIKPGESLSKSELKKRYHELLRQNHPDKVASLGADFKKLAEKKTKDINSAYEELKKKAS